MKRAALVVLLALAGCGDPPRKEPEAKPSPAASPAASAAPEQPTLVVHKPGRKSSLLYTWRDQFPQSLPAKTGEPAWILAEADYILTEDTNNAWHLKYVVAKTDRSLDAVVIEYPGDQVAGEKYEAARNVAGVLVARDGRYFLAFTRSDHAEVPAETAKPVIDSLAACIHPKPEEAPK